MRIGEVGDETGVPATTLRFYEREGLLPAPARTSAGYRDYDPAILGRVAFVKQGQPAGLTLRQIRQILDLRDRGLTPCAHVAELVDERLADVERSITELERARVELRAVRERLQDLDPVDCDPSSICAAIA